jgi:hypothetical protein
LPIDTDLFLFNFLPRIFYFNTKNLFFYFPAAKAGRGGKKNIQVLSNYFVFTKFQKKKKEKRKQQVNVHYSGFSFNVSTQYRCLFLLKQFSLIWG